MENKYGYVRVSTKDQNEDRQVEAMKQLKILEENIYIEKTSGKNFNRPMYQNLIKKLKPDDLLYITINEQILNFAQTKDTLC